MNNKKIREIILGKALLEGRLTVDQAVQEEAP